MIDNFISGFHLIDEFSQSVEFQQGDEFHRGDEYHKGFSSVEFVSWGRVWQYLLLKSCGIPSFTFVMAYAQ